MNADDRFGQAVEWARARIRPDDRTQRGMVDPPRQSPQEHAAAILSFLDYAAVDDSAAATYEGDVRAHLKLATHDRFSFKVTASLAAAHLRAGAPMPPPLIAFAADVLDGAPEPKKRGPQQRRPGRLVDDVDLGRLVWLVRRKFDLGWYDNRKPAALTAARAVEKALAAKGTAMVGHARIVKACQPWKKGHDEALKAAGE